jgi:hypothetical protein
MACKLTKSTKPGVDFEGKIGDEVQIGIASDSGGALIVAALYAGTALAAPWKFTLKAGTPNKPTPLLTVLVDNPVTKDWTTLQEICNGGANTLLHWPFDPYGPSQSLAIEAT